MTLLSSAAASCLQCGALPARPGAAICRRCGIPFGAPPSEDVVLPECPICYRTVEDDGRLASLVNPGIRVGIAEHMTEHDSHPVGDDDWLESLRRGDRIAVGRWLAPYDLVRRYLVTGSLDGGRRRTFEHDAIVTAMTQLRRFGIDAVILGDQPEWREARHAVSVLMERYHRR